MMTTGAPTIADLRAAYINAAVERSQNLPRQSFGLGETLQFVMPHAGVARYAVLDFQGSLVIGGTGGSIALSPKAPFNFLQNVNYVDYLGTTRVNAGAWKLYERMLTMKYGWAENNPINSQSYYSTLYDASVGGGTGVAGTYPLNFSVVVPIALHENTTQGSLPFTLPEGQNVISVTFPASLIGSTVDFPIQQTTAGFTAALTGTMGCTYYYYDGLQGVPLPQGDFQVVHELREVKVSENLVAGQEFIFPLPTQRTYYMAIQDMILDGKMDTADITRIKFLQDGNTPMLDEYLYPYLLRNFMAHNNNFPTGMFVHNWWRKPWTPSQYGSLATSLEISNSATIVQGDYSSILLESLYKSSQVITG